MLQYCAPDPTPPHPNSKNANKNPKKCQKKTASWSTALARTRLPFIDISIAKKWTVHGQCKIPKKSIEMEGNHPNFIESLISLSLYHREFDFHYQNQVSFHHQNLWTKYDQIIQTSSLLWLRDHIMIIIPDGFSLGWWLKNDPQKWTWNYQSNIHHPHTLW